jgi:hypothetical protein
VKVGGHPMESVSYGLWKEKWGGVLSFIKEHKSANLSLKTCLVWTIVRTSLPVVDKNNHFSKQIFISVLQMKSSRTSLVEKRILVAHQFRLCVTHMGCATIATPLVKIYQWRISICATHNLPMCGAYCYMRH